MRGRGGRDVDLNLYLYLYDYVMKSFSGFYMCITLEIVTILDSHQAPRPINPLWILGGVKWI